MNSVGNSQNVISSSEYLLPKNDGQLFPTNRISAAEVQNPLTSTSINHPAAQSNNLSHNDTNIVQASENLGIMSKGAQHMYVKEPNPAKDISSTESGGRNVLTRENVNDHNNLNSNDKTRPLDYISNGTKSTYVQDKKCSADGKRVTVSDEYKVFENNEIDLDQTTMIGSALDLDSLSGDKEQNNLHIIKQQDYNACDENSFVTTKACTISEQCKTAGISAIHPEKRTRNSNRNSTKQSVLGGSSNTYYQSSNPGNSFDPSAV